MQYFRSAVIWGFILFIAVMGPVLVAQAIDTTPPGAINQASTVDEWGNSLLWAITSSWVMKWWRNSPHMTFFNNDTGLKVQRLITSVIAFFNGLGLTFVFDKVTGDFVIHGLVLTSLAHGVRQILLQELVYHGALKNSPTQ